jgi:hypothetical protein
VPAFRDKHISGVGFELLNLSPDRFAALMSATRDVYAHRLKDLNLKLE